MFYKGISLIFRLSSLLFIVLLFGCAKESKNESPNYLPLEVSSIQLGNQSGKVETTNQIVFSFNQNIAILGAVPSSEQISAVSISHGLEKKCTWRFVTLNKLACDLTQRLNYLTKYTIKLDNSFSALGKVLNRSIEKVIETPFPPIIMSFGDDYQEFPTDISLIDYLATDIPLDAYDQALKLKLPSGQYLNLSATVSKEKYKERDLVISLKGKDTPNEQGMYQVVLPKGFSVGSQKIALSEEKVLGQFWYGQDFTFLGFACSNGNYHRRFTSVSLTPDNIIDCPPEKVAFKFSKPPAFNQQLQNAHGYIGESVDWLKGEKHSALRVAKDERVFYYLVSLSGDADYELDLSLIHSLSGQAIVNPKRISFSTKQATPTWSFDPALGTVVESEGAGTPHIVRRNVNNLEQLITPIETSNDLLNFLNNKTTPIKKVLTPTQESKSFLAEQALTFRHYLSSNKGLVHINLTGIHQNEYGTQENSIKTESFMAQTADYNIAVWHHQDLVVQVYNWQAQAMASVDVQLLCQGLNSPVKLGQTDDSGSLWLKVKQWQHINSKVNSESCWIWTEKQTSHAAIKLPQTQVSFNQQLNAHAWAAQPIYQPGDIVNIGVIARMRTELGIKSLTSFNDYSVELVTPKQNDPIVLNVSSMSKQGFVSSSYQLVKNADLGYYRVRLKNKVTGDSQTIGQFMVAEFTPPEFEQQISAPNEAKINEVFLAHVKANRMNGVALQNAKVKISARIQRNYNTPKTWPRGYEFNSWEDFNENTNGKERLVRVNTKLNEQGSYKYVSKTLQSSVPFGQIVVDSTVISDDGEAQRLQSKTNYFARPHYIGTQFDNKTNTLKIIAIDQQGNELNDILTKVEFYKADDDKREKVLQTCEFNALPSSCLVKALSERRQIVISSGNEQFKWYRTIYARTANPKNDEESTAKFSLTAEQKSYRQGETVKLNLTSSFTGNAHFILQAGTVQKVWQQKIEAGDNEVVLKADASMLPYARVYVSLPIDKNTGNQQFSEALKSNIGQLRGYQLETKIRSIKQNNRLYTSVVQFKVSSKQTNPKVSLALPAETVEAGQVVTLKITADQDSESQLWLVNKALLPFMRVNSEDFDYQKRLYSTRAFEDEITVEHLASRLVLEGMLGESNNGDIEAFSQTRKRLAASMPGIALSSGKFGDGESDKSDFAQSIWLETLALKANQQQQFEIKLPQLIGRWKLFALTATQQTMSLDSIDLKTSRDLEYFLDVPKSTFDIDQAEFAITQINRSNQYIKDTLTLWLGDKKFKEIPIELEANAYTRTTYSLPSVSSGQYHVRLTSQHQPKFSAYAALNVLPSAQTKTQTWLINDNINQVKSPESFIPGSLNLSKLAAGNGSLDWHALSKFNQGYEHQCWEQTLSRAVSYHFNPVAGQHWPAGASILSKLISRKDEFESYLNLYSFFPGMKADAFLTGYTYLASKWLEQSDTPLMLDKEKLKQTVENIIESEEYHQYVNIDATARSMALLALAVNGDISLEQALQIRQNIGKSDAQATALQALALKSLNANPVLYSHELKTLSTNGYQDTHINVFNSSVEKCLAIAAFEQQSRERNVLVDQVLKQQNQVGHFGSTFANAVCAFALHKAQVEPVAYTAVNFTKDHTAINLNKDNVSHHWLKLEYQQDLEHLKPITSGVSIAKTLYVKRNELWQEVSSSDTLHVGEMVKTTITINSPIKREHIAIIDSIPGGLEAINPQVGNSLYNKALGDNWRSHSRIEIREGKAHWYLRNLSQGEQRFSYFNRVRHTGTYYIGPAEIEAMYRTDVFSSTSAGKIQVAK